VNAEFVAKSNHTSDRLRIWVVRPGDQWRARIECADLTAEAKFYERYSRDALRLDAYFGELAKQWRGWKGDIEWEALGLRLTARHDGLGHVTLDATLDEDYASADRWRVRASLALDAGSLDRLAVEARVLDER
jgi:uncharacterized protein DUF6228